MAITKIRPIKSTLNLAIDYITKSEKTDEKILVSSFKSYPSTDHILFMKHERSYSIAYFKIKKKWLIPLLFYLFSIFYNIPNSVWNITSH